MKITYRKLFKYKYKLTDEFTYNTNIIGFEIDNPYIRLSHDGVLQVAESYAWDGPSGPAVDTKKFMRGSLVHDVLYQLIRLGLIPPSYKKNADLLLKNICIEDGMRPIWAIIIYFGLQAWTGKSATPGYDKEPDKEYMAP